jgi:hypothetical protein
MARVGVTQPAQCGSELEGGVSITKMIEARGWPSENRTHAGVEPTSKILPA